MTKLIKETLYQEIVKNIPICTVDILIFSEDFKKILLFLRNNEPAKHIYYTIGGRLRKDEYPSQCAVRKIKEEIGLSIEQNKIHFTNAIYEKFINCYFSENITSNYINLVYYTSSINEEDIILDNQHSKFKWFDLREGDFHKYIKQKVNLVLQLNKGVED